MRKKTSFYKDIKAAFLFGVAVLFLNSGFAQSLQEENKKVQQETNELLRDAEDHLADNDFSSAEAAYRQAVSKNPESVKAKYNMANMYYGKEKPAQAVTRLKQAASVAEAKEDKHKIFHNMGNSFMEQKKYKEAVEAYKNALRNNPKDEETRYNLALAKQKLEKEDPQGGGGDENQDQQDQNQEDQNKGDQGEKEQDKQEGENEQDQGGEQNEESQQEPEKRDDQGEPKEQQQKENGQPDQPQQPQQPQPGQLSPQQIKSLLEAMNNEEKKVQDKINAEKAKGAKTRTEKDW